VSGETGASAVAPALVAPARPPGPRGAATVHPQDLGG